MTIGQHVRVLFCVVIMGCIVGIVMNGSEIATDSPFIDYVQTQHWPYSDEQTISEVFTAHYQLTYWEYYTARSGEHVVQFTGTTDAQQFLFQFVVQEDFSGFTIGAIKQNNILLPPDTKSAYLKSLAHHKKTPKS